MTNFGARLKAAFGDDINAEIARKLGVSEAAVTNYVNGRVPDSVKLLKIAALTNCDLHWLLTGEGRPPNRDKPPDLGDLIEERLRQIVHEELKKERRHMVLPLDVGKKEEKNKERKEDKVA